MQLIHWFREGGWPMFAILLVALLAHGGMVVALVVGLTSPARRTAFGMAAVCLGASLAVATLGWGGYSFGMRQVYEALAQVPSDLRAELWAQGRSEAMHCLELGFGGAFLPLLGTLVLGGRAASLPSS